MFQSLYLNILYHIHIPLDVYTHNIILINCEPPSWICASMWDKNAAERIILYILNTIHFKGNRYWYWLHTGWLQQLQNTSDSKMAAILDLCKLGMQWKYCDVLYIQNPFKYLNTVHFDNRLKILGVVATFTRFWLNFEYLKNKG